MAMPPYLSETDRLKEEIDELRAKLKRRGIVMVILFVLFFVSLLVMSPSC